jgi:hypothetical protein
MFFLLVFCLHPSLSAGHLYDLKANFLSPESQNFDDPFFIALYLKLNECISKKNYDINALFSYAANIAKKREGLKIIFLEGQISSGFVLRFNRKNILVFVENGDVKIDFFEDSYITDKMLASNLDYMMNYCDIVDYIKKLCLERESRKQVVVAVTGRPRSGKTETSRQIAEDIRKMGIDVFVVMTDELKNMQDDIQFTKQMHVFREQARRPKVVIIEGVSADLGFYELGFDKPDIQVLIEADRQIRRSRLDPQAYETEDLLDYDFDKFECEVNFKLDTSSVSFSRNMNEGFSILIRNIRAMLPLHKKDLMDIAKSMPGSISREIQLLEINGIEGSV